MADTQRNLEPSGVDAARKDVEGAVELTPAQLRKICGGASVPPPNPQPDTVIRK
jgi:hypothetical protein